MERLNKDEDTHATYIHIHNILVYGMVHAMYEIIEVIRIILLKTFFHIITLFVMSSGIGRGKLVLDTTFSNLILSRTTYFSIFETLRFEKRKSTSHFIFLLERGKKNISPKENRTPSYLQPELFDASSILFY